MRYFSTFGKICDPFKAAANVVNLKKIHMFRATSSMQKCRKIIIKTCCCRL